VATKILRDFGGRVNWWFWGAWIETPQRPVTPLYALAAKTEATTAQAESVERKLPSGAKLVKVELRVSKEAGDKWLQQARSVPAEIALGEMLPGAPSVDVSSVRDVLVDAFGQSPVTVHHYVGQVAATTFMRQVPDTVQAVDYLARELGLPFRESFAGHLGGFDVFELKPPFDAGPLFDSTVVQENGMTFLRLERQVPDRDLSVTARLQSMGESLVQRLISWPRGAAMLQLDVQPSVDEITVEVYDAATGELVHREECTFLMETHLSFGVAERTLHHQDALVQRAGSLSESDRGRALRSTAQSRQLTAVGATPARTHVRQLQRAVEEMTGVTTDKWFARGVGGELDVIDHINTLLNDGDVQRALLVDPFFGEEALRRFVLRVENTKLALSVITSWGRTDPDTAEPVSRGALSNEVRLGRLIEAIVPVIACSFRVQNIVTAGGDQAFHDRYLAVYRTNSDCQIWLLSNSINAMAMNWPFCMSELKGLARWQAQKYLEELEGGNDLTSGKTLSVTYRWPEVRQAADAP